MSKKNQQSTVKKRSWLGQAFIVSIAMNIGLMSSLVYIACKKNIQTVDFPVDKAASEVVSKSFYTSTSSTDVLPEFFDASFEELFQYLADDTLVEDGYRKRDFALACLVSFHHFDIKKALSGTQLQERFLEFTHKDGGEKITLKVYPGLDDEQFDAIGHFAKVEKWPLTTQGIFFELQRASEGNYPKDLKESFYLSPEFHSVQKLFDKLEKSDVLGLMIDGGWDFIEDFHKACLMNNDFSKDVQRYFLSFLIDKRSKKAAKFLLENDLEFALKKLDDARVVCLLSLVDKTVENTQDFVVQLVNSARSDAVHKKAGLKLYELFEKNPPEVFDLNRVYKDFKIPTESSETVEKDSENLKKIVQDIAKEKNVKKSIDKSEPKEQFYVVQKGDSLWIIAKKFNVKINDLKDKNNLKYSSIIKPGMKLKIP